MFNLFKHELSSRWRMIFLWGIGLTLWGSIYVGSAPDIASELDAFADMEMVAAMGMDLSTIEGYLASVIIQVLPIILGVYMIMLGTGTLAGEDDKGTLEMVVAMPLKRWQIVAMKASALSLFIFLIVVLFSAGSTVVLSLVKDSSSVPINIEPQAFFFALMGTYPLMIAIFGMSLFIGSIMPNRRTALAVMAAIYIGSYLANSVSGLVDSMAWLEPFSIFSYLDASEQVLTDGVALGNVLTLLGIGIVFILLAIVAFQGRNVTVGQWFWQRTRIASS